MSLRRLALSGSVLSSAGAGCRAATSDILEEHITSSLLKERIVCINGPILHETVFVALRQLRFLQSECSSKPIHLYILNSPEAVSEGSLLLAAGAPGERRASPHSRIKIHQPSGLPLRQATESAIHANEKIRESLYEIYSRHTGQPIQKIKEFMERDMFMSADQAKEFGLID
ncbi:hypothetical protein ZIOFF_030806 [Zingiber officinale]|uniref:ATP-dependent Clp protease proteolytic subunit n=1 Tax=Zingiber officinale TaxID=94328 RepID=A0A8J5GTV6_ZINOF|nr:hypothetical protein ZIOFF_030806 [Zingiber officinale]